MFWEHFKKGITEEEAGRWVEEAISKMKDCSLFELERVENLEKLYKAGDWNFSKNGDRFFRGMVSISVSPDYSQIRKVSVDISGMRDKEISKGHIYYAVSKAYLYHRNLQQRNFEKLEQPSSLYLADLLLRGNEKSFKKYRWQIGSNYFAFLMNEEKNGIENTFNQAIELKYNELRKSLDLGEIPKYPYFLFPTAMTAYFAVVILGSLAGLDTHLILGIGTPLLVGSFLYVGKKASHLRKWMMENVYNIARELPPGLK